MYPNVLYFASLLSLKFLSREPFSLPRLHTVRRAVT